MQYTHDTPEDLHNRILNIGKQAVFLYRWSLGGLAIQMAHMTDIHRALSSVQSIYVILVANSAGNT